MTIEAKVISDSISEAGIRLTTFQVKYQRFIKLDDLFRKADTIIEEQECLFIKYINANPKEKGKPLFLSCPCPKCTPRF